MLAQRTAPFRASSSTVASRVPCVRVQASAGGFGKTNKKPRTDDASGTYTGNTRKKRVDLSKELANLDAPSKASSEPAFDPKEGNWIEIASDVTNLFTTKEVKLVELAAGQKLVLYRYKNQIFCSDCYSTAVST